MLAVDENVQLHENLVNPVRQLFNTSDYLYLAWVIPGIIFFTIFGLLYLKFLLSQSKKIRLLFILAGTIFISGAIGTEIIGSHIQYQFGRDNFQYSLVTTLEELLEMIGLIIFIDAMLIFIKNNYPNISISIVRDNN